MNNSMQYMFEGSAEVAQTATMLNTFYVPLYNEILKHIPDMYELVKGTAYKVEFTLPDAFRNSEGLQFTVKVLLDEHEWKQGYYPKRNTLLLAIRNWLQDRKWSFNNRSRLPALKSKEQFIRDMQASLSYELKFVLQTPSVCRLLTHELTHYFDHNMHRGMTSADRDLDNFEMGRDERIASYGLSPFEAKRVEDVRDELFPARYVKIGYSGKDYRILKDMRESFGPDDYKVFSEGKKNPKYDELIRRSNLYKYRAYLSSNPEMKARLAEQIPQLVTTRNQNSEKLDVKETVTRMMDNVFIVPQEHDYVPSEFGSLEEYRRHAMRKAMPGAFRSIARRLTKIVIAFNAVDVEKNRSVLTRMTELATIMGKDTEHRGGDR